MGSGVLNQETDISTTRRGGADVEAASSMPTRAPQSYGGTAETTPPFPIGDQPIRDDDAPKRIANSTSPTTRVLAPDLLRGLLMVLMALDHTVVALNSWRHGQGGDGELDGAIVRRWNWSLAYAIRTLTHLCAPGFTFLMGMGVAYFGQSRARLGWTSYQMIRHFAIRAAILTLITVLMGVIFTAGKVWFLNAVMFSLAIDYFLAGLLWLVVNKTEPALQQLVGRWLPEFTEPAATQPLLNESRSVATPTSKATARANTISWHVHNLALLALAAVTIWWNIWLSPNSGHCQAEDVMPVVSTSLPQNTAVQIWFRIVQTERIISVFPPLAWLSFAILGLLYGRLLIARSWSPVATKCTTILAASGFALLFVLTRVFHFGNLSEGCLQTEDQASHPGSNQYLASPQSFFYLVKYPPDVAFFAYTMAGNLFLLALFDVIPFQVTKRFTLLLTYGKSALFFYLAHQVILFSLGAVLQSLFGHELDYEDPISGRNAVGVENVWVYFGLCASVLAILYPLCQWYSRFKQTKAPNSIWRFF
ncbi:hypothetical protein DL766_001396 [Monosporascus sp. MC13-8B]|uniref:Heparan-alpha-glucosaminide N-acetyltransferase catalytic domain-containing protein n=1 Tax=Monosporascus cannonballus TaxID=155416 RepID=A0ABY0HLJ2_9PEZI|nr:hypothetical protein DL762_001225 [Monosporascus cannonballus]RYO98876.1 hypothetical protein DL763_001919 [Monosporascus cannonballus]RYP37747.1 hypothetical protein DL766_001396 [Monosporascus sp. MC13-8B]